MDENQFNRLPRETFVFSSKQTINFERDGLRYQLIIDPEFQNSIKVKSNLGSEEWKIDWKGRRDSLVSVGGMVQRNSAIVSEWLWFQLELGTNPKISYWGDQTLVLEDIALNT